MVAKLKHFLLSDASDWVKGSLLPSSITLKHAASSCYTWRQYHFFFLHYPEEVQHTSRAVKVSDAARPRASEPPVNEVLLRSPEVLRPRYKLQSVSALVKVPHNSVTLFF